MGIVKSMAKDMIREIGNKSREFYEFVLPPVDIHLEGNDILIVTIDIPGFNKKDIHLTISSNILSIKAKKQTSDEKKENVVCQQRPSIIDKKIRLPVYIKKGDEKINFAKYDNGVLTISISISKYGKDITIE
jgi:HSP20 family molecular chaperone IbpA